jgi:hypothetical protein
MTPLRRSALFFVAALACGCADDEASSTTALYELDADLATAFYDFPYPSDLRLAASGGPDLSGFLNPEDNVLVDGFLEIAGDRPGFPTVAVGYFRFSAPLAPHDADEALPGAAADPVLLIDVDPSSPTRGALIPTVAATLTADPYTPEHVLAIGARPGFILHPSRQYALVVTDALLDAAGAPVAASPGFAALRDEGTPEGARGPAAAASLEPLWPALELVGVPRRSVVAATVFTTGDVVAETAALGDRVRDAVDVTIEGLSLDPDDGATHPRFCELHATVTLPQYQRGEPPFNDDGLFDLGADGLPIEQRRETANVVVTLPKEPMPAGGYPLVLYFHGSGGVAAQVVDRGAVTVPDGPEKKGEGPAHVLAAHGFATVGAALPVNPERLPGASEIAYLNLDNLKAFRDTFRQGVIEQRLLLDALLELTIDPAIVAGCDGLSLPAGETAYRFSLERLGAMGQSMGGMYTNLVGATEPRIEVVVPTGAGGMWSLFILETSLIGGSGLVPLVLGTEAELVFMHPALHLLETGWEPAEPAVYMPRLARRPLAGHPVRPIYEPVGKDDSFFPTVLYDAIALAYGHQQAGDEVWPTMQEALALAHLDGFASYPIEGNLSAEGGSPYTGVVVQYEGDGIYDPHSIFSQLDEVKHQYGCFLETFHETGKAVVVAPASLGSACE